MSEPTKTSKCKHILVVDDDTLFRGALVAAVTSAGFQVSSAEHAKTAQDIVGMGGIDLVISDINMPGISGTDLLLFIKQTCPDVPVILMTGFSELQATVEAHAMGASGFLAKPFKKEDLLQIIDQILNPVVIKQENENAKTDNDYCKIAIDDFVSGQEIKFDVYIRLSEIKYVKIAHQGENIPMERIHAYKEKNIQYLYMTKEAFQQYLGFNLQLAPLVLKSKSLSIEKKVSFLKHTSDVMLEHLHLNGVNKESFQAAKTVIESTTSLLTDNESTMDLLTHLNSHADFLYAHALGVSMYGVMIAKKMKWITPSNIYKVAMGGLMHDIGKKEIDRDILLKKRKDLTSAEIKIYESHPYRGMEILSGIHGVPTDVLQIVAQHHENCQGLGFPLRVPKNRIHPMAKVIAVANEFCGFVIKNPAEDLHTPVNAINKMLLLHSEKLDHTAFAALMQIFGVKPPEHFTTES